MERVTGTGGILFKTRDPEALKRWYAERLSVLRAAGVKVDDKIESYDALDAISLCA